jgi:enoyl-CoA hydratase/carnithine racemase
MTGAEQSGAYSIKVPESLGVESLKSFMHLLEGVSPVATLLLYGDSNTFCRGMSLGEISLQNTEALQESLALYEQCLWKLRTAPVPSVCIVQGEALGGGLGLAAACDILIATEDARFGLPEGLFGLLPGMVLPIIAERISAQKLRRLALTCESIDAKSALSIGLIDEIVSKENLETRKKALCKKLGRVSKAAVNVLKHYTADHPQNLKTELQVGRLLTFERLQDPNVIRRMSLFITEGIAPWEKQ